MKLEYDTRMRALESNITSGSLVLLKLKKERKTTPIWDPDPYRVISINGKQITAEGHDRTTKRNYPFFKLYREDEDESFPPTSTSTSPFFTVSAFPESIISTPPIISSSFPAQSPNHDDAPTWGRQTKRRIQFFTTRGGDWPGSSFIFRRNYHHQ